MKQIKIYILKLFESGDILEFFFFCSMLAVLLLYNFNTNKIQTKYDDNIKIL